MKKMKKLLALLLALSLLAGCGAATSSVASAPEEPPASVAAEQPAEETPAEQPAEIPEETSAEEVSAAEPPAEEVQEPEGFVPVEYSFPLVEETETLTYFATISPNNASFMEDYSTNESVKALEELTGVHIDYSCYIPENAQTQFNLQAAAGTLPDIILGATEYYTGGMDTAVEDEILINLADYLDLAPNYSQILDLTPDMRSSLTTEAGNLIGFYAYSDPAIATPVSASMMIRGDWLEQVGMEAPSTYDELHDVLVAFKEQIGVEYPMLVTSYLDDMGGSFASGFDIKAFFMTSPGIQVPFYVVDGQVKCAIVEEAFVDYIKMIQDMVAEGLVDPNVESYSNEMSYQDKVLAGETGVFWGFGIRDMETLNSQMDGYLVAVPAMRKTEDQTLHFTSSASYEVRSAVSLSANCSNVELACKWLDAHYTEEISMMAMYGVEGVSYEMVDGKPAYTEMMLNPEEEGMTLNTQKSLYCLAEADNIYYKSINTDLDNYSEAQIEALELVNSGNMDDEYVYPSGASMTTEESETYNALIADLSTYMAEHVLKFVVGVEPMSDYQAFIDTLFEMGMQDAIDIKQAAYDRYVGA